MKEVSREARVEKRGEWGGISRRGEGSMRVSERMGRWVQKEKS